MPTFTPASLNRLATIHQKLQEVLDEAIKHFSFEILSGYKNAAQQDRSYLEGNSPHQWPTSKQNKVPALAVELAPWHPVPPHIRWTDYESFVILSEVVKAAAEKTGVNIAWGGDAKKYRNLLFYELM